MTSTDIRATTTTSMDTQVSDFSIDNKIIDEGGGTKEYYWTNPKWSEYLGCYKQIPELKEAIRAVARYTKGLGYNTNTSAKVRLDFIQGWGEDSFQSILQRLSVL